MARSGYHVVWFKRDLRIEDHAALIAASQQGVVLPLFIWAPQVWQAADAQRSQAGFVSEALQDLAGALHNLGLHLHVYHADPLTLLQRLHQKYGIAALYSHEETGNAVTYQIDLAVAAWTRNQGIAWQAFPQNGVVRCLANRDRWHGHWERRMRAPLQAHLSASIHALQVPTEVIPHHGLARLPTVGGEEQVARQRGGRMVGKSVFDDFLSHRVTAYREGMSSPLLAVTACSRISPYLAWGCLSLREVVQTTRAHHQQAEQDAYKKNIHAFESRLHWHCHFMQKLETEPRIEFESFYPGFDTLHTAGTWSPARLQAWQRGQTGWPIVDACMAMLRSTGWLNFRMRAMLMSTASYLLWLPWRETGLHLAREFLDYEPGIHWPQVQMQSGTTGINTLRMYHPVKQAMVQDPQGRFVRQWIPALREVPNAWIFEPWRMPDTLQRRYGCVLGRDYPTPMVDIGAAMRHAKQQLTTIRQALHTSGAIAPLLQQHASRKTQYFPKMIRGLPPAIARRTRVTQAQNSPLQAQLFSDPSSLKVN